MGPLFSPCTRLYDLIESLGRLEVLRNHHPELLHELNLNVSTEELLRAEKAFTYADVYAMLGNERTVVWLTPHAAVAREGGRRAISFSSYLPDCYRFCFSVDGKMIVAVARSPQHLLEICDVVVRLFAASVVHSVCLTNPIFPHDTSITAPILAYLMEQCQSLKSLSLKNLEMDENHCRVLGAYSRPGLEIVLENCRIAGAATAVLAQAFGRNHGPTKLNLCEIDAFVLADGLRQNSRLKSLTPRFSRNAEVRDRELLAIAGALRENKGLVNLDLNCALGMSDVTWGAICDSLKAHPTLEVLDFSARSADGTGTTAPAVLKSYALLDMMKVNVSIRTLRLDLSLTSTNVYRESVIPYLVTNRVRPRVRAIQRTRPISYRAKVLGRALLAVRTDPNRFWMLLSENAEVVFA
jgi:hypothetical protein